MNSYNKFLVFALVLFIGLGVACAAGVDDAGMDDTTDSSPVSEVMAETNMDSGNLPVEDDVGDNTDPGANPTPYTSISETTYENAVLTLSGDQSFADGVATFGSNVTLKSDSVKRTLGNFKIVVSGNNVTINNTMPNINLNSYDKNIKNDNENYLTINADNLSSYGMLNGPMIVITSLPSDTYVILDVDNIISNVGVSVLIYANVPSSKLRIVSTNYILLVSVYVPIVDTYLPYSSVQGASAGLVNSVFFSDNGFALGNLENSTVFSLDDNYVALDYNKYSSYFDSNTNIIMDNVKSGSTILLRNYSVNQQKFNNYDNPMIINKPVNITSFDNANYGADITFVSGSEGSNITGLTLNGNLYINTSNINVRNNTINKGVFVNEGSGVVIEENTFNTDETAIVLAGAIQNTIQNNNITTTSTYTITLDADSAENTITGNNLQAAELTGTASVLDNGEDNVISDGGDEPITVEPVLKVDTTEFTVGEAATITASIYRGDEVDSSISKGKVVFKVNGKTLKDSTGKVIYAKITGGVASITGFEVPFGWTKNDTVISAVYSGCVDCEALTSEAVTISVTQSTPSISASDVTASKGETVTLTATVVAGDTPVNVGKVIFKVNGKTVKDSNGKVIYAKVVNGQVSVNYTIPENMKAGNYNITVTFTAPGYDKLTDTKTLIVSG